MNTQSKAQLPQHLHAAYDWIDSAGEWTEALSDPGYAAGAYANAVEQNQSDVTQSDIEDAIEWFRKQNAPSSEAQAKSVVEAADVMSPTRFASYRDMEGNLVELEGASVEELAAELPEDYEGPSIQVEDKQGFTRGWIRSRNDWRAQ
jgi:hypothetical protein